ncbi:O-antigen polysaccharide polymerase Wzy [Gillisia hiemivivida]|uniref:O-antigen polysaccharide polymerase Wzy n=1 Tax=Gillisia hiemivivida TaxID=291190 RepID=A0A5C6ZYD0_9FLAO|nr:O-antigen polysaccharide polymerase Wzy [Gillisia hiemivivida]TXD95738.1 O-antigen polysaccharide polymerase Wzy [Gillisia hiemivivida]
MQRFYQVIFIVILIFLFFSAPDYKGPLDNNHLARISLLFGFSVVLYFFANRKKIQNWFRVEIIFLLGFIIVHFQWPVMYVFSNISTDIANYNIWVDEQYVNFGTWLSAVGGMAFLLGLSFIKRKKIEKPFGYHFKYSKLLYFTVFLFILFLLTAGREFLSGGIYKGTDERNYGSGIAAYLQLLFSICIIVLTFFVIFEFKDRYKGNLLQWVLGLDKVYLVLSLVYILVFLAIGDRGGPLALIITFSILIGYFVRPIKLKEFVITCILGSFLMTIIGIGRAINSNTNVVIAGYNNLEISSGYDITLNLANSVRVVYKSVSEIPKNHDFFYGKLWLGGFLSPIPFAQSIYLDLTQDNPYELSSAEYITYLQYGKNPTSGEGTSVIADIYLNFGVGGVFFFMFLFGILTKKADNSLKYPDNINWILMAVIIASFSFYLGRGSIVMMLRPLIWSLAITLLFVKKKREYIEF